MPEKNYDSTIMRIAGNLLSGLNPEVLPYVRDANQLSENERAKARWAVAMAREIVAETLRAPAPQEPT